MNIGDFLNTELEGKALSNLKEKLQYSDFYYSELEHYTEMVVEDYSEHFFSIGLTGVENISITDNYHPSVSYIGKIELSHTPSRDTLFDWRKHLEKCYSENYRTSGLKEMEEKYIGKQMISQEDCKLVTRLNEEYSCDISFTFSDDEIEYEYFRDTNALEAIQLLLDLSPDEFHTPIVKQFEVAHLLDEIDSEEADKYHTELWELESKFLESFLDRVVATANVVLATLTKEILDSYKKSEDYLLTEEHFKDVFYNEDTWIMDYKFDEEANIIE